MALQIRVITTLVVAALLMSTAESFAIVGNFNSPCQQSLISLESSTQLMSTAAKSYDNKCQNNNIKISLQQQREQTTKNMNVQQKLFKSIIQIAIALTVSATSSSIVYADGQTESFKFPPIDFGDKDRCKLNSSTIGQANAARDKLYDLRQCQLSGLKAIGYDLSGVSKFKKCLSIRIYFTYSFTYFLSQFEIFHVFF
jgi:hypothetical protein